MPEDEDDTEPFSTNDLLPPDPRKQVKNKINNEIEHQVILNRLKKNEPNKCSIDGCEKFTTRESGMCKACEDKFEPYLNCVILHCEHCPTQSYCKYGKNELGICIYEMRLDEDDLKEKESIERMMTRILKTEEKMFDRFSRICSTRDLNTSNKDNHEQVVALSKQMQTWTQTLFEHIKAYAMFKGWTKTAVDKEMVKERINGLKKVLGRDMKKAAYKHSNPQDPNVVKITVPPIVTETEKDVNSEELPDEDDEDDEDVLEKTDKLLENEDNNLNDDMLELEKLEEEYINLQKKSTDEDEKEEE